MRKMFLVLLLVAMPAFAWADEYVLVMSKEDNVCQQMHKLYNEDLRKYGKIKYDEHEEFTAIKWEGKKYYTTFPDGKKHYNAIAPYDMVLISKFDINNDGKEDIVVKIEGFLSGIISESLYYFKGEDADYFKDSEFDVYLLYTKATGGVGGGADFKGNAYELKELPKVSLGKILGKETEGYQVIGGHFYVNPFLFKGSYYIDMKDKQESLDKWLVILKYSQENKPKDICYYLKVSDTKTKTQRRK